MQQRFFVCRILGPIDPVSKSWNTKCPFDVFWKMSLPCPKILSIANATCWTNSFSDLSFTIADRICRIVRCASFPVYRTTNTVYRTTNADAGLGPDMFKGGFENLTKKAINYPIRPLISRK